MLFQKFINQVNQIKIDEVIRRAASRVTEDVEAENRKNLDRGRRNDNSAIRPRYASVKYKGRLTPVDLKVTGAFHGSIKAVATANALETGSAHTVKGFNLAAHLEDRYSGNSSIYGISIKKLKPLLIPETVKELRGEL